MPHIPFANGFVMPLRSALFSQRSLVLTLIALLGAGFLATSLLSYYASRASIRDSIVNTELPLTSDTVYSEIQKDLVRPILISSMMSRDTFLRDWVVAGEQDSGQMTRYLNEVMTHYGAYTAFFVSNNTLTYYQAKGVLKKVSTTEPRDIWYFSPQQLAAFNDRFTNRNPTTRTDWAGLYGIHEESSAAYAQLNLEGDRWSGNVGLRYVRTEERIHNNVSGTGSPDAITGSDFGPYLPVITRHTYTDLLPSANFKFDITEDLVARIAAGGLRPYTSHTITSLAALMTTSHTNAFNSTFAQWQGRQCLYAGWVVVSNQLGYIGNESQEVVILGNKSPLLVEEISNADEACGTDVPIPTCAFSASGHSAKRGKIAFIVVWGLVHSHKNSIGIHGYFYKSVHGRQCRGNFGH